MHDWNACKNINCPNSRQTSCTYFDRVVPSSWNALYFTIIYLLID